MNKGFETLRDNNDIIIEMMYRLSKSDELFFENLKKFIKNSHKFTVEQSFYFILEYFALFMNLCEIDHKIPFLSVAPNPYLPPSLAPEKYTLVVDLLQIMHCPKKH
jgi:hypothetical protein